MRRSILAVLAVLVALAPLAWAMTYRYSSGTAGISVTQANTNTAIVDNHSGGGGTAFGATSMVVCSRAVSANSCFVDTKDGVATTADDRIEPGACMYYTYHGASGTGYTAFGAICAAGETATFDVKAGR